MTRLTPSEVKASLARQAMLEKWSDKLIISTASKVSAEQAELLADAERHLAGRLESQKRKSADRRKILPDFLRKKLTRWRTILSLKLLAWSLRKSWSSFWWLRRIILRTRVFCSSSRGFQKLRRAASRTSSALRTARKNTLAAWRFVFGGNTWATNTSSRMRVSLRSTLSSTVCGISRAFRKATKFSRR